MYLRLFVIQHVLVHVLSNIPLVICDPKRCRMSFDADHSEGRSPMEIENGNERAKSNSIGAISLVKFSDL